MPIKEPMLADKVRWNDMHNLPWPMLASPKMDGIRAVNDEQRLLSRKLKLIPNKHTQTLFSDKRLLGMDGELVVGPPNSSTVYNTTLSGVMSRAGEPSVAFYIFDNFHIDLPFEKRIEEVKHMVDDLKARGYPVKFVKHHWLNSTANLLDFEDKCLTFGYEGVMLRRRDGPYKQGRATYNEGCWLLKMKRVEDAEAVIIGVKEKMHNDNPAEVNELGRTKRSSHKANKRAADTFGGLVLQLPNGTVFNAPMGKGWDDNAKHALWERREQLIGKTVVFESLPIGVKDRPRHPKAKKIEGIEVKGFRNVEIDG
jgi:DNA ligase-1